jgi:hypothetical protein
MTLKKLYRGDSDKAGDRILKKSIREGFLCTNLISGGNPRSIFREPLLDLVKRHITPGWGKTHFLSFSEYKDKAVEFGAYGFIGDHCPYYDYEDIWHFALLKFDPTNLGTTIERERGVYVCSYTNSLIEFRDGCRILLINTVEYLKANSALNADSELSNAERDKEWLILPINEILLNNNIVEFSAKLDRGNIITYELYEVR